MALSLQQGLEGTDNFYKKMMVMTMFLVQHGNHDRSRRK
jgi:hypothetical protein